jgi:hypothetical protein
MYRTNFSKCIFERKNREGLVSQPSVNEDDEDDQVLIRGKLIFLVIDQKIEIESNEAVG